MVDAINALRETLAMKLKISILSLLVAALVLPSLAGCALQQDANSSDAQSKKALAKSKKGSKTPAATSDQVAQPPANASQAQPAPGGGVVAPEQQPAPAGNTLNGL